MIDFPSHSGSIFTNQNELPALQSKLAEFLSGQAKSKPALLRHYHKQLGKYLVLLNEAKNNKLKIHGVDNLEAEIKNTEALLEAIDKVQLKKETAQKNETSGQTEDSKQDEVKQEEKPVSEKEEGETKEEKEEKSSVEEEIGKK